MAGENKLPGYMPARHGLSWNTEEYQDLYDRYAKGWTIQQLAEKHQRTFNAIKIALHGKESDLIINGTNYGSLFYNVKQLIKNKIELSSKLPYG